MSREEYELDKWLLQIELLKLQNWLKASGQRLMVLFETPPVKAARSNGSWSTSTRVVLERMLVRSGIHLVKVWFSVSRREQQTRFVIRQVDPVRRWKLSPTDLASLDQWDDYTEAKEAMFFYSDTADAPWTLIKSNDKKRARIQAMRHLLSQLDYDNKDVELVGAPGSSASRPGVPTIRGRRAAKTPIPATVERRDAPVSGAGAGPSSFQGHSVKHCWISFRAWRTWPARVRQLHLHPRSSALEPR